MNATQTKEKTMKKGNSTESKVGNYMTAKEMALLSHNLSTDGDTASRRDGSIWKWSNHFNVWACMATKETDPKLCRETRRNTRKSA